MSVSTFTITFGDQAENHVGMEKIGNAAASGFQLTDLERIHHEMTQRGYTSELYHLVEMLNTLGNDRRESATPAHVLVIRRGLEALLPPDATVDDFFREQTELKKDDKALMYGRVVNKHARHNLCFGDVGHAPNYEQGQGTVVAFDSVPILRAVRESIRNLTGHQLVAEGNYYYDVRKCGIGYHGDSERRIVVGVRVGEAMPLHYRWYQRGEVVSPTLKIVLGHGDVYVMSEKATGWDWKMRSQLTLRHAAGSSKFLDEANDRN